jgi:SAM-dependent methyltransferase
MLAIAATKSNVMPIPATAHGLAVEMARRGLPDKFDALLLRSVAHHFHDPEDTVAELIADHLLPGGRALAISWPPSMQLPLFSAARQKWEELEPDPVAHLVIEGMRRSGLEVTVSHVDSTITISRDHYLEMVRDRFISLLSFFDDDELEAGIGEMSRLFPADVSFVESLVFMVGEKRNP